MRKIILQKVREIELRERKRVYNDSPRSRTFRASTLQQDDLSLPRRMQESYGEEVKEEEFERKTMSGYERQSSQETREFFDKPSTKVNAPPTSPKKSQEGRLDTKNENFGKNQNSTKKLFSEVDWVDLFLLSILSGLLDNFNLFQKVCLSMTALDSNYTKIEKITLTLPIEYSYGFFQAFIALLCFSGSFICEHEPYQLIGNLSMISSIGGFFTLFLPLNDSTAPLFTSVYPLVYSVGLISSIFITIEIIQKTTGRRDARRLAVIAVYYCIKVTTTRAFNVVLAIIFSKNHDFEDFNFFDFESTIILK